MFSLERKSYLRDFSEVFILNVTKCNCRFIQLREIPFRCLLNFPPTHFRNVKCYSQSKCHIKDSIPQKNGQVEWWQCGKENKTHLISRMHPDLGLGLYKFPSLSYTCSWPIKANITDRMRLQSFLNSPLREQSGKYSLNAFL